MTARSLTTALAGRWTGSYGLCFCPAHDDGKTPALKVSDDDRKSDGIDLHCFGGCGWRDVKNELRRRGLLSGREQRNPGQAARRGQAEAKPPPDSDDRRARIIAAKRIWVESRSAAGTAVERYLRSRGITLDLPPTLRFHPALKHGPTGLHLPALVAAVTTWPGREVVAVHRTFLKADGSSKAPASQNKMMLRRCSGGAVRLAAAGGELVLAEGIETALSVLQATGRPTWATLSTSGMKAVVLPLEARTVIIAADGDEPGDRAAEEAGRRFCREGREVKIARPPAGMDFNDLLSGCGLRAKCPRV